MESIISKLLDISYSLLDTAHKLQSPEAIPVPSKENIIEEARKTLRWLRNLQHTSYDMEEWMQLDGISEQQNKAELLQNLISIYAGQVKMAQLTNPETLNHFTIESANHAAGSLALSIALHTLETLPDEHPEIERLDGSLDDILPEWDHRQAQSVEQLIDAVESGLTHLTNKPLGDRSPVDRLLEISSKIQETVLKLHSIDSLEEPAREESVELAREILRKLKNITFGDQAIEESIGPGRPNEKLAFAQKISEMVDMYKNLLHEASITNPDIISDPRVKSANDAVGDCSEGIKLLAAKELPSSRAASQNISADLKGLQGGGKDLSGRTIHRLMDKMEDGLEQAADEVSSHERKAAQAQIELAAHAHNEKMRRRRRRHRNSGGHGHSSSSHGSDKVQNNIRVAQAHIRSQQVKHKVNKLNQMDMAAIKQAGNSLRKNNQQANDMMNAGKKSGKTANVMGTLSSVPLNSPLSPDDQSFASRERDPLNPNNPRNRPRVI
jgi:hypothetical protein